LPSGDILCADKCVGRGKGGGGWYIAVKPPVPSYSGSGVEGIASIVQHSMRAFCSNASWISDVFCVDLVFLNVGDSGPFCTGRKLACSYNVEV